MKTKALIVSITVFVHAVAAVARGAFFVMPQDGALYAKSVGGFGGGVSEFGTGTSQGDFHAILTGLPANPSSGGEVLVGAFAAGASVEFGIKTEYGGSFFVLSSDTSSPAARTAFMDLDNSLGMGGGVVQSAGANQYLLNLDDAASYLYDDNDFDFLIQLRVVPGVPEPTGLCAGMAVTGLVLKRPRQVCR